MPRYDYATLKDFEGKRVRLVATRGEVVEAVVYHVYEDEQDLAYDVLSTNEPGWYEGRKPGTTFVIPFEYIGEITLLQSERNQS